MPEWLIDGLAKVFGVIGAGVLGQWLGRKLEKRKSRTELETQLGERSRSLGEQLHARFGFKARSLESSMYVDARGNSKVTRIWQGLEASAGMSIAYFPGTFWVATPGGRIGGVPALRGVEGYRKAVSLRIGSLSDQECRFRVEIAGNLTPNDPPLDLELGVEYIGNVLMSREAVERAYGSEPFKHDYLAFDVEFPVERVVLNVGFEDASRVRFFPGVFLGWSEVAHDQELHRVQAGFERRQSGSRFEIREPLIGFRYLIFWAFES